MYRNLSVADMLHLTGNLNRRFDQGYAQARLGELGIPLKRKTGQLSGGQQAQLALTLALARRPRLLVLDEPMAMLDPLARHDFMATVLTAVADDGVSVLLSSHVLAELERVADYLILMSAGRVQVAGEVDDLLACHRVLTGPAAEAARYAERSCVVHARSGEALAHLLVRTNGTDGPGAAGLGRASGQPGRTHPGLPARTGRRGAARPGARRERRAGGGSEVTTLTVPTQPGQDHGLRPVPWRRNGLGHLAPAPAHADQRARAARRGGRVPVDRGTEDPPRLRGPDRLPPVHIQRLPGTEQLVQQHRLDDGQYHRHLAAAGSGADRRVRGRPLLARELETGTFRYAWTQGFGRERRTIAKLALLAVAITAAAGAFSQVFTWFFQPFLGQQSLTVLSATVFDTRGIDFAAWTLAAFTIGALAGMLIRRIIPAMAVTLGAYLGLDLLTWLVLRPHYPLALVTSNASLFNGSGPSGPRALSPSSQLLELPVDAEHMVDRPRRQAG